MTFTVLERAAMSLPYDEPGIFGFHPGLFDSIIPVTMAEGSHPFPFRTRPLSPPAPMVLPG